MVLGPERSVVFDVVTLETLSDGHYPPSPPLPTTTATSTTNCAVPTTTHLPTCPRQAVVEREDSADAARGDAPPDVETVFSQVRNGRLKRLEDSLEKGFPVDTEDEYGNTALMVACQVGHALR